MQNSIKEEREREDREMDGGRRIFYELYFMILKYTLSVVLWELATQKIPHKVTLNNSIEFTDRMQYANH
jgi:hypothetical protein